MGRNGFAADGHIPTIAADGGGGSSVDGGGALSDWLSDSTRVSEFGDLAGPGRGDRGRVMSCTASIARHGSG